VCYFQDCTTPGTWRPILVLKSKQKDPGTEVRFRDDSKVSACGEHHLTLTMPDYLSPEGVDVLTRHLRERAQPLPDKKHNVLRWEEICGEGPGRLAK
jgi:hypothetical protein